MDHRALKEAGEINGTKNNVLKFVGGKISPEMETPKLLWVSRHLKSSWKRASHFFDLADYLTYRCTGDLSRSLCTLVCKWTFLGHHLMRSDGDKPDVVGWDVDYFNSIGLGDLVSPPQSCSRIGTQVCSLGTALNSSLSQKSADELGLSVHTIVATSLIDAHAGGLGLLGIVTEEDRSEMRSIESVITRRLAIISGTSSCHMIVGGTSNLEVPRLVPGVWGPYFSAMVPGMWLFEGGQSATGKLISEVVETHKCFDQLKQLAYSQNISNWDALANHAQSMAERDEESIDFLTRDVHLLPYFHGNRSPRADPSLTGVITGRTLTSGSTLDGLVVLYLATVQAVCFGTRHIIEALNKERDRDQSVASLAMTGGLSLNSLFVSQMASICDMPVIIGAEEQSVLLGSAVCAAVASKLHEDISGEPNLTFRMLKTMGAMEKVGKVYVPHSNAKSASNCREYFEKKYSVFLEMYHDQMKYRRMMSSSSDS